MALQLGSLQIIAAHLPWANVLSLSYPDLLVKAEDVELHFGYKPTRFNAKGTIHGRDYPLPETIEFFEHQNASLRCIDMARFRGVEEIVDLNYPVDLGKYDLVINPGTLEHCFNIGVAMISASEAVKPGGRIYHEAPVGMLNHGFYNLCPTLFNDFYAQNGWKIEFWALYTPKGPKAMDKSLAVTRQHMPPESHMSCLVQRTNPEPVKMPIQWKYRKML